MKSFYFFLFAAAFSMAQAQGLKPFPTDNATWTFEQRVDPDGDLAATITYQLAGDTLIDNKLYDKLVSRTTYLGAIRYVDDRLYLYPPDSTRKFLLFDFNAKAGDTIFNAFDGRKFWNIPILEVDSILINGDFRRVWHTHCEEWIEGIGGTWSWLYPRSSIMCLFQDITLTCFQQGEEHYGTCKKVYEPTFVNEKNQWHEAFCCQSDSLAGKIVFGLTRYLFRDTVQRAGKIYRKLYASTAADYNNFQFTNILYREDSTGKVFITRTNYPDFAEDLIYDFSAVVGDTVRLRIGSNHIVVGIDSVTLNSGAKRKRLQLRLIGSTQSNIFWIEGIGGNYARLNPFVNFIPECSLTFACYQYEGVIEYETEKCNLRTSTQDILAPFTVKIVPNPFATSITIETTSNTIRTIQLFDAQGRQVLQKNDVQSNIDLSFLPQGLYYLHLIDADGYAHTERVVKME